MPVARLQGGRHTSRMRRDKRASVLTTLVFTDIVSSTAIAEEMGDRRWQELLSRHYQIIRRTLREQDGKERDTAGDGVFSSFDSPASAVRWACAAVDSLRELGIWIRVGIHIGEAEVRQGKLSGINVHAAARTMALAGAGQIFVTGSVRDIVRGSGFGFEDRGVHELRGLEGEWHVFEVTSVDGTPRPAPPSRDEARARRDAIEPPPLVKRRSTRLAGIAVGAAAVLGGVALALLFTVGSKSSALPRTGCEVAPYPPLNDRAFNQAVFDGLTDADTTWGVSVRNRVTDPPSEAAARENIKAFAEQGCGLIVTVGGFMGPTTAEIAKKYPDQRFLTTDDVVPRHLDNLANVVFDVDQAAFLAGYLAAGVTRTGTVATFGGIPIATVTPFMKGFAAGVLRYNREHAAHVQLLGWDVGAGGTFVSSDTKDAGVFDDAAGAANLTRNFIRADADVIMPVDGQGGELGAGRAVRASRKPVLLIGVDTDQHYATPQFVDLWLTSVLKVYRRMVYLTMGEVVLGRFEGGPVTGTLGNGGVALAPYYGLGKRVPGRLQRELEKIEKGIEDGSISLDPASYV
jgi:basic membrane protein A and related proteins